MIDAARRNGRLLNVLAVFVLAVFLLGLMACSLPTAAQRHLLFALGVLPLILGAMLYFVPVLTRSAAAHGTMLLLPLLAIIGGGFAVVAVATRPTWLPAVAVGASIPVGLALGWIVRRRAHVLGSVHPGVDWYVSALVALLAALLAIVVAARWPESWPALRNLHLHLNLLGFLGLTAIGTLRVLLPTVLGRNDPTVMAFLRRQLLWAALGTAAVALGAAVWPPLSLFGVLLWLGPAIGLVQVLPACRERWLKLHTASTALGAAAFGWLVLLAAGVPHAVGYVDTDVMFALLMFGFLFPLVTGATSYLLPVWRWPGRPAAVHAAMRERLVRFSGVRVGAFWSSAAAAVAGYELAFLPAALALAAYLLQVVLATVRVGEIS